MRRRPVIVAAAVLVAAAACSPPTRSGERARGGSASPVVEQAPTTWATDASRDPTVPWPGPVLPQPVDIPKDSYAPEPVRRIGTMEIPAIGLVHPIYQGVTLHNIDRGPSHWTGSAMPGEMGNTVFAGHRSTETEPFRRIDDLVPGDEVRFTVDGVRTTYRVTDHLIVSPSDTWIAGQEPAYTGTLYACHPIGSTDQRYVVRMALAE